MRIMGPTTQFGAPDFADTEAENAVSDAEALMAVHGK